MKVRINVHCFTHIIHASFLDSDNYQRLSNIGFAAFARRIGKYGVDRRLVTNTLLTFLCMPREDTKRFEILGLLASILSWSDEERARAGLQNNPASSANNSPARSRPLELDKTDETEVCDAALPERDNCAKGLFSHSPVSGWNSFLQKRD